MRSEMFQKAISNIDDELIEAADVKKEKMKSKSLFKWASVAAAACLVIVCAFAVAPMLKGNTPNPVIPNPVIPSVNYPEYTETSSFFYEGDVCENEVATITHKSFDEKSITLSIDKKTDDLLTIAFKGWKSNKADVLVNNATDLMLYINGEETNQMPTAPGKYEVKIDYSSFAKKCDELDVYMYVSGFGYFCLNGEGYRIVGIDDISELTTSTEK